MIELLIIVFNLRAVSSACFMRCAGLMPAAGLSRLCFKVLLSLSSPRS
jgi:hypothetical protein